MMIVGIASVSIFGGMSYAGRAQEWTREHLRAMEIIEEKMEFIRLCTWEQLQDTKFLPTQFEVPFDTMNPHGNPIIYKGTLKLSNLNGQMFESYKTEMVKATFELTWTAQGKPKKTEVTTFVAKHGLQHYIP